MSAASQGQGLEPVQMAVLMDYIHFESILPGCLSRHCWSAAALGRVFVWVTSGLQTGFSEFLLLMESVCPAACRRKWTPTLVFCTAFLQRCISDLVFTLPAACPQGRGWLAGRSRGCQETWSTGDRENSSQGWLGLASMALMVASSSPSA